jgi:hypothetical protein
LRLCRWLSTIFFSCGRIENLSKFICCIIWSLEKVQRRFAKSFIYFSSGEYPQRGVPHETLLELLGVNWLALNFSQTFLITQLIAPTYYRSFPSEFPPLVVVSIIPSIRILRGPNCYNVLAYIRLLRITLSLMWRESWTFFVPKGKRSEHWVPIQPNRVSTVFSPWESVILIADRF